MKRIKNALATVWLVSYALVFAACDWLTYNNRKARKATDTPTTPAPGHTSQSDHPLAP